MRDYTDILKRSGDLVGAVLTAALPDHSLAVVNDAVSANRYCGAVAASALATEHAPESTGAA